MIVRPTDQNGDMVPIAYASQMISGAKAVAQVVKQRLSLYFGEWWEDESIGFRLPQFLADGVRQENIEMLVKYISSYVAATDGVTSVDGTSIVMDGRRMFYSCVVHVGEETEQLEVELDGVLSSQY